MARELQKISIEKLWELSSTIRKTTPHPVPPVDDYIGSHDEPEVRLFTDSITKTLEVLE